MERKDLGMALMAFSAIPIAYSLGWLDFLFRGGTGAPTPHPNGNLSMAVAAENCAWPFGDDRGRIRAFRPDGSDAVGANVYMAVEGGSGGTPPAKPYPYYGTTDGEGYLHIGPWGSTASAWVYAQDPTNTYGESNLARVC